MAESEKKPGYWMKVQNVKEVGPNEKTFTIPAPQDSDTCLCTIHCLNEHVPGAVYDPGGWRVPNQHCPVDHEPRDSEGESPPTEEGGEDGRRT